MKNLPSFYSQKLAFGPAVVKALQNGLDPIHLDDPMGKTLPRVAEALGKRVQELVVVVLNRPRHADLIREIRQAGSALRLISDGDIAAAVAPSLPDSGVDLYCGSGGSPEGVLAAAALRALGGEMLLRMWPRDAAEKSELRSSISEMELNQIYRTSDLVTGDSCVFCATGISDSAMLPGVKLTGKKATTHSILMRARSRTVRHIRAVHDLETKTIHLRSIHREQTL